LEFLFVNGAAREEATLGKPTLQPRTGSSEKNCSWQEQFLPGVKGVGLRSMSNPGSAYDDPRLGKDPQPKHMSGYAQLANTQDQDNGGVHFNSGIPNHAFYLAAKAIGEPAWKTAGSI
jgi:Zn-dependent metalloprotease